LTKPSRIRSRIFHSQSNTRKGKIKYPMTCTSKQGCENTAKFWLEVEVNVAVSCEEHYKVIKKSSPVYSEGLLPNNQIDTEKLIHGKLSEVTERLKKRGIKHPVEFRDKENEILRQIENIAPKRFDKLRKQYAKLGANDEDLQMIDDHYKLQNVIANIGGLSHPPCTKCGQLATWWYLTRSRKLFRCEEHKKDLESPVYDQGAIPDEGIPTSDNDFHQRLDDYLIGSGNRRKYTYKELGDEIVGCEYCNKLLILAKRYFEADSIKKKSITFEVNEHMRINHPKNYSMHSFTKEGYEHSYIIENADDYWENFMKFEKKFPIPEQFVGKELTGDVRDALLVKNMALRLDGLEGEEEHTDMLVSLLKPKNLQPITVCRLLQNLDMVWEIKYNVLYQLFGDTVYSKYLKHYEVLGKVMEDCVQCITITRNKSMVADKIKNKQKLKEHFIESHPNLVYLIDEYTQEIHFEQKYSVSIRENVIVALHQCMTCKTIIDDEEVSDTEAEKIFQDHVKNHHKALKELGINLIDILLKPEFLEDGAGVTRAIKFTTITEEKERKTKEEKETPEPEPEPKIPVSTPPPEPPDKPKKITIYEFRRLIPTWNIKSIEDWKRFTKSQVFPDDVPINPHIAYKQDWQGYPKEFAYEKTRKKLTPEQIQDIVKTFGERWLDYKHFPDAIILDWFSTFDLFNVTDPFWKTLFKNFLSWRQDPQAIAYIRYCFSTGDLKQQFGRFSCIPKVRETRKDVLERTQTRLDDVRQLELLSEDKPIGVTGVMLNTENVVPNKIADPKWYNMHIHFRNKQIWETLFDEDTFEKELALLKTYKKGTNEFRDDVLEKFWKEYNEVITFNYAKEFYKFKFPPKLIQLYGAYRMKRESGFFNMASTGDYKTGQAIISAVSSNSMNCLAIVPATIVDQWIRNIRLFYPHCQITSGKEIPESFFIKNGRFHTNFHVISYGLWQTKKTAKYLLEQFSGKAVIFQQVSKVLKSGKEKSKEIHSSIPKTIDFVILDEAHFVKQRFDDSEESNYNRKANRRIYIQELLEQERRKNRKMKALFLSATPSINNVQEAKSLLEMVTGVKYDSIKNYSNIRNAVKCYTEFLPVSLNHVKRYNIKTKGKDEPITVEGFLPDYYTDEQIRKLSYLELDQIATKYRIPKIIELLKKCKGKSVIYSYYRTGVINQIQEALSKEINPETGEPYRVGFYTGLDKSGMVRKTGKVDVDGNEIIENPFILGEIDVLIATRAFGVGFDGVQEVCNNIFFNGFVFTYGDFEQIIGRLIRSGQFSDTVNVYLIFAKLNGVAFDYELKYLRVKAKKSLGDCIKHGTLPKRIRIGKQDKQRKRALDTMLKNKISGFPTKEKVERELETEAMKQLDEQINIYFTEVEKLERMKRE